MFSRSSPMRVRYAFTISVVALATLLRFALEPVLNLEVPFILYFPTVVLCAWFGGLRQGVLATLLSSLIAWYVFFPPQYSFKVSDRTAPAQVIIFLLAGTLISALAESLHRAQRRTEASEAREREQREQYRIILASTGDAVIATDANGCVSFMNKVAESLTGWNQEAASGKPLEEVFQIINEHTRTQVENPALRAMREGRIVGLANHTILIPKEGAEIPIDDSGAPLKDATGKTLGAVLIFRDITERRLAEDRFRLAVESAPNAMVMVDEEGRIVLVNSQTERLFGYARQELIGQPIEMLVPARLRQQHPAYRAGFAAVPQTRPMGAGRDLFGLRKDGSEVPIEIGLNPLQVKGKTMVLSSIVDISSRRQSERALRESEELYRATFANAPVGVAHVGLDGRWLRFNDAICAITGYTREELYTKTFADITHPDDIEADWAQAQRLVTGEISTYSMEKRYLRSDGSIVWVNLTVSLLRDTNQQPLHYISVVEDITARKQAEEALRAREAELESIINQTPFMLTRCSRDLRYRFISHAYAAMIGLSPEEVEGKPIAEIMGEEGFKTILPHLEKVLAGQRVEYESEVPFQKAGVRSLQVVYMPEMDEQENVKGWIASILDVTDRKRAEKERLHLLASERAAREQAEAANRAKDEFVAMISHEIRSPLNSILGWAQMLRTGKFDAVETARAVEVIERNARAQLQLIEDLLDISRVITGKLTLEVRTVELGQIIENALESIRPAAEAKAIQLQVQLAARDQLLTGDPNRLQQIVWNLLSNAVKFTPTQGRIEVTLERIADQLQLTVRDSGLGISPEFLPFVFDRFSQANTSSERKYSGLGLGLAIVRHLVELHGGTIHADSEGEGQGATFTVRFPLRAAQSQTSDVAQTTFGSEYDTALIDAIRLDGLRVLVVDDEAESRELVLAILTQRRVEVKACASAAEALAILEQWQPAVVISDIAMPEEDGYGFIKKLRALEATRGWKIPAVALTGYARREDRRRTLAAGFQVHIPKPVEAVELIVVIASLAGRLDKARAEEIE